MTRAKATLEEIITSLHAGVEKYQLLRALMKHNSNYRMVDADTTLLNEAESLQRIASLHRLSARNAGKAAEETFKEHLGHARTFVRQAEKMYKDDLLNKQRSSDCVRGQGDCLKTLGEIYLEEDNPERAKECWTKAVQLYQQSEAISAQLAMNHRLDKLAFQMDKVHFINTRLKNMLGSENREREAVLKAFQKFDADDSGEMDLSEFAAFAIELGTSPALREDELEEAIQQLDNSKDGKISFDELWAWWISDEIHQALQRKTRGY